MEPDRDRRRSRIDRRTCGDGARAHAAPTTCSTASTRPFKELPPKHFYDARGSRALRPRSPSCPSTTRPAPSARSSTRARREIVAADAAPASWSSSARAPRRRRVCCSTRWPTPARCGATCRSTSPRQIVRDCATRSSTSTRASRVHGSSATSSATSAASRARRRRGWSPSSAARSATSRPARADASWRARRRARPGDRCCSAPTSSRTRRPARPPTTTRPGSPPSSTATCCACSTASSAPTSTSTRFEHVAFYDPEQRVDRDAPARAGAQRVAHRALDLTSHFAAARRCAPRSAPSSRRERLEGDLRGGGPRADRWCTDAEGLFALSLARAL